VVYHLTKDFDLIFNILNATILPGKEGVMVMELSGSKKNFRDGVKFSERPGHQGPECLARGQARQLQVHALRSLHGGLPDRGTVDPASADGGRLRPGKVQHLRVVRQRLPPRAMEVRPIRDALAQ